MAYAGDKDLPLEYREFIIALGPRVSIFDVLSVFDDTRLNLGHSGWAIKAFTLLGSHFEQAMLLDADDVFLQAPEVVFERDPRYLESGALLFYDRLLWPGAFPERHAW